MKREIPGNSEKREMVKIPPELAKYFAVLTMLMRRKYDEVLYDAQTSGDNEKFDAMTKIKAELTNILGPYSQTRRMFPDKIKEARLNVRMFLSSFMGRELTATESAASDRLVNSFNSLLRNLNTRFYYDWPKDNE